METQNKGTAVYEDEINLYDYWKVIVKRKILIIGLFLVATLAAAIISLLMPKIYRGEVILKLPAITAKELLGIIGKIDAEKIKNILPETHHLIAGIKLNVLKDSTDKLQLIIEAKNTNGIPAAMTEFAAYLNNFSIITRAVEEERQRLLKQSEELSKVIEQSNKLAESYEKLLKTGKLIPMGFNIAGFNIAGFNPIDIRKKISDWEVEKFTIEQALNRPKGVEMIEKPSILKNPVKPKIKMNIALAGMVSLFVGVFLVFLMEYVEKMR
ncbi:MAG: Wzz/FepE/Etk N-terminal domain-containing protein, partial [Candidatus Subteraquimicrobiales bacterium]|nr:Wzz/FepE/Etk N-terminal domain-containing protein [Candidatus Subteraquimicrobiales bacterium]